MPKAAEIPGDLPGDDPKKTDPTDTGFDDLRRASDPVPPLDLTGDAAAASVQGGEAGQDGAREEKGDDDLQSLTGAMRKRLARQRQSHERALATKEREFKEALEVQNQRIADLEAKLSKRGLLDGETQGELSDLEAQMEQALERGDSKTVAKLNIKIAQMAARPSKRQPDEPQDLDAGRRQLGDEPAKPQGQPTQPKVIPRVQQWLDEQTWWDDPAHSHVREFISNRLDSKLQAAGYSPREDAYFEELERIVEERYPGVVQKTSERERKFMNMLDDEDDGIEIRPRSAGQQPPRRQAPRAPVGRGDDGAGDGGTPRPRGGTRLSADEVRTMRTFGLDPTNPKHVEGFIQNR